MIDEIYAIKDDLSGKFTMFGQFINEAVAKREFQRYANLDGMPTTDYTLYRIGSFDHNTGCLTGCSLVFVDRGERKNA